MDNLPNPNEVDPYKFKWDLTKPCSDCPFIKDTPTHDGIHSNLQSIVGHLEHGNFAHSCHKTHPGADGWNPEYRGEIQNCAGLTIMQHKLGEPTYPMVRAILSNELDESKLDLSANTFVDIKDMVDHYKKNHLVIRFLMR